MCRSLRSNSSTSRLHWSAACAWCARLGVQDRRRSRHRLRRRAPANSRHRRAPGTSPATIRPRLGIECSSVPMLAAPASGSPKKTSAGTSSSPSASTPINVSVTASWVRASCWHHSIDGDRTRRDGAEVIRTPKSDEPVLRCQRPVGLGRNESAVSVNSDGRHRKRSAADCSTSPPESAQTATDSASTKTGPGPNSPSTPSEHSPRSRHPAHSR